MTSFTLGINTGFAINRYPEPEVWAPMVAEDLGLHTVQLVADLLNPFWPEAVIEAEMERILRVIEQYDIDVHSLMTSAFTRVNHFMYPFPKLRQAYADWFKRFADLAMRLGAEAVGSHFGILSVRDVKDPQRYRERVDEAVRHWQELSHHARDVGLKYIYFETMSIPREMAHTIEEARTLRARVNEDAGVPLYFCLDVGHAPHPDQRDPYLWLRELGAGSRIVHLQQTERGHSRHWPFTPTYNAVGIIEPQRVLDTLANSGAEEILLAFEISHRERYEVEPRVVPDLKASVAYWRQFLPQDGTWEGTEGEGERRSAED
ncbi:MAG: sugar phosphate isomerase/epimerase [Anaerolineae bacterium]